MTGSTRPRTAWIALLLGVPLGVGAYTVRYAEATSYLSEDPAVCVNCHVMREHYDGWQKGGHHAAATCNDCHLPQAFISRYLTKIEHGYRHSKGFTFQDFKEPIRVTPRSLAIVEDNCVRCHAELTSNITDHAFMHGEAPNCTHCHAQAGHGPLR